MIPLIKPVATVVCYLPVVGCTATGIQKALFVLQSGLFKKKKDRIWNGEGAVLARPQGRKA